MSKVFDLLFGCWHKNCTFPITTDRKRGAYICCLDCGKEFPYSMDKMQVVPQRKTA